MNNKVTYKICKDDSNITIKELLKKCHVGRGKIEEIRVNKASFVNNKYESLEYVLKENDILSFSFDEDIDFAIEDKPLNVAYEDDYILIVNKPTNLIIHPDDKNKTGTLVNRVANYYKNNNINRRVRYIHRIDKESSGLVMFAKDFLTDSILEDDLINHKIKRSYLAITEGHYDQDYGTIKINIGEDRHQSNKMCASKNGKEAITKYKVFKKFSKYDLVLFTLVTGRTHQIRVHTSFLHHPILGDVLYGGNYELINRVALHSYELDFIHPITHERLVIKCEPLEDMKRLLRKQ